MAFRWWGGGGGSAIALSVHLYKQAERTKKHLKQILKETPLEGRNTPKK